MGLFQERMDQGNSGENWETDSCMHGNYLENNCGNLDHVERMDQQIVLGD